MTTPWYTKKTFSTWRKLFNCLESYLEKPVAEAQWVFRGHHNESWALETGIERLRKLFGVDWSELPSYEWKLLREFRRRAHIYHPSPPEKHETLEWLALLRHHVGPTRLLDFTYSPFIAAYFALEDAHEDKDKDKYKDCAVWAISSKWLGDQAKTVVTDGRCCGAKMFQSFSAKRDGESFKNIFWCKPFLRFVSSANPIPLNERLTLQQGVFLCPGDITASFEENLKAANNVKKNVHKISISNKCRIEALSRLRKMNIDRTTLFPGLDGFAQSLNTRFKEIGEMPIVDEDDTTW